MRKKKTHFGCIFISYFSINVVFNNSIDDKWNRTKSREWWTLIYRYWSLFMEWNVHLLAFNICTLTAHTHKSEPTNNKRQEKSEKKYRTIFLPRMILVVCRWRQISKQQQNSRVIRRNLLVSSSSNKVKWNQSPLKQFKNEKKKSKLIQFHALNLEWQMNFSFSNEYICKPSKHMLFNRWIARSCVK